MDLRPGSVIFLQHCGSLLNLNLHFHVLMLDGAFVYRANKRPYFHKTPNPSDQQVAELLESIIEAVELRLSKQGLLEKGLSGEAPDDLLRASVEQRIAFVERHGQKVRRLDFSREGDAIEFKGPQCVALSGFSLHAARRVEP